MKCNHLQIIVQQEKTESTTYIRDKYGKWTNDPALSNYIGIIRVICIDCGFKRIYYSHKKIPKWLQKCLINLIYNKNKKELT